MTLRTLNRSIRAWLSAFITAVGIILIAFPLALLLGDPKEDE